MLVEVVYFACLRLSVVADHNLMHNHAVNISEKVSAQSRYDKFCAPNISHNSKAIAWTSLRRALAGT